MYGELRISLSIRKVRKETLYGKEKEEENKEILAPFPHLEGLHLQRGIFRSGDHQSISGKSAWN